jgi:hypothetical protein
LSRRAFEVFFFGTAMSGGQSIEALLGYSRTGVDDATEESE